MKESGKEKVRRGECRRKKKISHFFVDIEQSPVSLACTSFECRPCARAPRLQTRSMRAWRACGPSPALVHSNPSATGGTPPSLPSSSIALETKLRGCC